MASSPATGDSDSAQHDGGDTQVRARMQSWLDLAVIGLNLCPFARGVRRHGLLHIAISTASDTEDALQALQQQAEQLEGLAETERETTLLVLPSLHGDFWDFMQLVQHGERQLKRAGYSGVFQLASFHPDYVFAGSDQDDVANCSNRAPYATLHLLRESSLDRAVQSHPDTDGIYQRNIATLQRMGWEGWRRLATNFDTDSAEQGAGPTKPAQSGP